MKKDGPVSTKRGAFRNACADSIRLLTASVALAGAFGVAPPAALGAEPGWPSGPYKYIVFDQDLRDALVEFGRNVNMRVQVDDKIRGRRLRGPLPPGTAETFLKRVCDAHSLVWHFDGAVLHVSPESELKTELIDVTPLQASALPEKLQQLGVADTRFPIRTTADERLLSVWGPPSYLLTVRQALAAIHRSVTPRPARETPVNDAPAVRVFRGG